MIIEEKDWSYLPDCSSLNVGDFVLVANGDAKKQGIRSAVYCGRNIFMCRLYAVQIKNAYAFMKPNIDPPKFRRIKKIQEPEE